MTLMIAKQQDFPHAVCHQQNTLESHWTVIMADVSLSFNSPKRRKNRSLNECLSVVFRSLKLSRSWTILAERGMSLFDYVIFIQKVSKKFIVSSIINDLAYYPSLSGPCVFDWSGLTDNVRWLIEVLIFCYCYTLQGSVEMPSDIIV